VINCGAAGSELNSICSKLTNVGSSWNFLWCDIWDYVLESLKTKNWN